MTAGRHAARPLVLLALLLSVAGCGELSVTVATEELESSLADDIASTTAAQVDSVDCPGKQIEAAAGARAECTLTLPDGRSGPVEVTFTDDRGNFEYELSADAFE